MTKAAKIIVFSGSLRKESYNKKLAKLAAFQAEALGADVQFLDLADYPLPLFDEDIESAGAPENVVNLRELFDSANALLIASPEYNGSFTAVLKNTLDWLSRPTPEGQIQTNFSQFTVGIMAASPGGLGGIRGLSHIREVLSNLGSLVTPTSLALGAAYNAFDENGQLKDENMADRLSELVRNTLKICNWQR